MKVIWCSCNKYNADLQKEEFDNVPTKQVAMLYFMPVLKKLKKRGKDLSGVRPGLVMERGGRSERVINLRAKDITRKERFEIGAKL